MDVNGLAGSLEIYLGKDVLESKEGYFIPVQWTAYSRRIKAYQGEVIDKQNIHERFRRKLQACESNPDLIDSMIGKGYEISSIQCAQLFIRSTRWRLFATRQMNRS